MKRMILLLGLFCMAGAGANSVPQVPNSYPKPLHMPDIPGPGGGHCVFGDCREPISFRIFIRADGKVEFREMLRVTDRHYTALVRDTIKQWRFEPWTPPAAHPEGEEVTMSYAVAGYEGPAPDGDSPDWLNAAYVIELRDVTCRKLNDQVRSQQRGGKSKSNSPVPDIIARTRRQFFEGFVISEFVPEAERRELVRELYDAMPQIIEKCQASPDSRYIDSLPERLRRML